MVCVVPGCGKPMYTKKSGLCSKHYQQMSKYGQIYRSYREPNEIIVTGDIAKIIIIDRSTKMITAATIDADDVDKCKIYKWFRHSDGYIIAEGGGILLHTLIMGLKSVDHANMDKTDNRKENLRSCTKSQNQANREATRNKQQYKGVYRHSKSKTKWQAAIGRNGQQHYLGLFNTPIEAAMAYNKKAKELFGEFARLNIIQEDARL